MAENQVHNAGARFADRDVDAVTFRGKLGLPIHRWYRLTPSFAPRLADDIADYFGLGLDDRVLDPFCGVGTVPLCMKYREIPSWGIEINPYLHFVASVKTRPVPDLGQFENDARSFLARLRVELDQLPAERDASDYLTTHAADIPGIYRPDRWWSPGNLMQLVCLRRALRGFAATGDHLDLIKMGVLAILVPISNARHNHVSLTFASEPASTVDLGVILSDQLQRMVDDLRGAAVRPTAPATIHLGNSKQASAVLPPDPAITAVITSPPYPNRFSYARETRPHLFFFDFIRDARSVGDLEAQGIGGTWGKATSILARGVEPADPVIRALLSAHIGPIRDKSPILASYVTKYFNDMLEHAREIARVSRPRCQLAYVIGNSQFFGHAIPSDEMLGEVFRHAGFDLVRIDRMRRRQSKRGLHESVVFLRRG